MSRTEQENKCPHKHTKFQPTDDQWRCPACGSLEGLCVDNSVNFDCGSIHMDDYVMCYDCKESWSGKTAVAAIAKKDSMIDCEHCKGSGKVKKSGA